MTFQAFLGWASALAIKLFNREFSTSERENLMLRWRQFNCFLNLGHESVARGFGFGSP